MLSRLLSVARRQYWPVPAWPGRRRTAGRHRRARCRGFSLVEIMIVTLLIMSISGIALPLYAQAVDAARITRAIGDIRAMANEIMAFQILNGDVPNTLDEVGYGLHRDPYGNPYQYLKFGGGGGGPGGGGGGPGGGGGGSFMGAARKDKFLVPINSRYDLYSLGKDGESVPPLTAPQSRDDIVMANDGGFVGLAENY